MAERHTGRKRAVSPILPFDPRLPLTNRHRARPNWNRPDLPTQRRKPEDAALAAITCPRCSMRYHTRNRYTPSICAADKPPYVGQGRGCGWMLAVEPGLGGILKASAVMDVKVDPTTGKPDQKLASEALVKIMQDWQARGIGKLEVDRMNGRANFVINQGPNRMVGMYDEADERQRQDLFRQLRMGGDERK
jgi:hypothetical protein